MKCLCVVALVFVVINVLATSTHASSLSVLNEDAQWIAWKGLHEKSYNDEYEERFRRAIWVYNLKKIEENRKSVRSFTMELNYLADLTPIEYRHLMLGRRYRGNKSETCGTTFLPSSNIELPKTVDWRTKGCVTPVINQGELGRSWAYSATGSLEGQHCIITRQLVSLSAQKLAECCSSCISVDDAFKYMIVHNRIHTGRSYIDKTNNENCNFSTAAYGASLTGYMDIRSGSEYLLQAAIANTGPVSVAIDASHQSFQLYSDGVYDEPACSSTQLDHAVLVVGYGTLNGKDYWLVKNSWGEDWGMKGYIMMSRNNENQCGIATEASYPTGVTNLGKHSGNIEA